MMALRVFCGDNGKSKAPFVETRNGRSVDRLPEGPDWKYELMSY